MRARARARRHFTLTPSFRAAVKRALTDDFERLYRLRAVHVALSLRGVYDSDANITVITTARDQQEVGRLAAVMPYHGQAFEDFIPEDAR